MNSSLFLSRSLKASIQTIKHSKSLQNILKTRSQQYRKVNRTLNIILKPNSQISNQTNPVIDPTPQPANEINTLKEDSTIPISKISCPGCGAKLHCQNKKQQGFISADIYKELDKNELTYTYCLRCEYLNQKKKLFNLETNEFDYDEFIINKICAEKKAHVILLVDLLDIPNSIYSGWSKFINTKNNIDICVIGNKIDLLPNTGPAYYKSIIECLAKNFADKGIEGDRIKYVELISAKTGYNVEKLITSLFDLFNDEGDVYLLGTTNAGKSVLFNQLLKSDYCRTLASTAISRAITSFWPGTTLNMLKFPITFLNLKKEKLRSHRLKKDQILFEKIEEEREKMYKKEHDLKHAEYLGIVGQSFTPDVTTSDELNANIDSTYSLDPHTGVILEGENYGDSAKVEEKLVQDARELYRPSYYESRSTFFYDTPGVLNTHEILKYFSKQELQIVFPIGIIMPRIFWMQPGQSMFVSGLIRIDLLESTNNERVLFSIMASPAMPIINPFDTKEADKKYEELYEQGTALRVPYKHHIREQELPSLKSKTFDIKCIGNHKSKSDIVFNCFGWTAVTSLPGVKAKVCAHTIGGLGLELREPSLLPFIVNMRSQWFRKDGSQAFKSVYYSKPKTNLVY